MQISSANRPVRALPRLWVAFLMWTLHTDLKGLNIRLLRPLSKEPFELNGGLSADGMRGVQRVFERILDTGHWPDIKLYSDGSKKRFSLYLRVTEHVPSSADWLFVELKRTAQGRPQELAAVQMAIDRLLLEFGLDRMEPSAAILTAGMLPSDGIAYIDRFLQPMWRRLIASRDPKQVLLLTLLWQESVLLRVDSIAERLEHHCATAWQNLLKKIRTATNHQIVDGVEKDVSELLLMIKKPMEFSTRLPRDKLQHLRNPICPIWRPSSHGRAAEKRLRNYHLRLAVVALRRSHMPSARSKPSSSWFLENVVPECNALLQDIVRSVPRSMK